MDPSSRGISLVTSLGSGAVAVWLVSFAVGLETAAAGTARLRVRITARAKTIAFFMDISSFPKELYHTAKGRKYSLFTVTVVFLISVLVAFSGAFHTAVHHKAQHICLGVAQLLHAFGEHIAGAVILPEHHQQTVHIF